MPFKSEKQRKWMHANEPEMAKDWERKKKKSGAVNESSYTQRSILDFIKANKGAVESDPANIPRIKLFGPKQDSKYLNISLIGLAKIAKIVKTESVNEARTINVEPNWEGVWRHFKHIEKTNPSQWSKMKGQFRDSWIKLQRMADKKGWKSESVDEGFGGELKGKDREKFEKARKENAEQLGYKLTGKSDIRESWNQLRTNLISILKRKQHQKIDGVLVDMQTANLILKVWDALNSSNRKKFEKLPVKKMADVAWKLMK